MLNPRCNECGTVRYLEKLEMWECLAGMEGDCKINTNITREEFGILKSIDMVKEHNKKIWKQIKDGQEKLEELRLDGLPLAYSDMAQRLAQLGQQIFSNNVTMENLKHMIEEGEFK